MLAPPKSPRLVHTSPSGTTDGSSTMKRRYTEPVSVSLAPNRPWRRTTECTPSAPMTRVAPSEWSPSGSVHRATPERSAQVTSAEWTTVMRSAS